MKQNRIVQITALLLTLSVPGVGTAQERSARSPDTARDNPFGRIFYGDYTSPSVRALERGDERSLDALIREGKIRLSEDDAIRLALENNVDIHVERYGPYFSLWGIEKSEGVLNPVLQFGTNLNRIVTPSTSVLQGADTLLNLNTLYNVSLRKPFEVGLDVDVGFMTQRARTSSFFSSLNPSLTTGLSVTLTQHLLRDFGGISRGRFLRIARNNYSMSEADFVARTTDIITSVLNAYWDLVFSLEDIEVKEASLELAQVVLEQNRIQAQVGTMAPLDVVQAEAEVATRNEQMVTARFNRRILEDQLKKLISARMDPGLVTASIEPTSAADPPAGAVSDVAQAIERALEVRPEVKRQQMDLRNREIQVAYTRNQLRPVLDLTASYSQNGLGGDLILRDFSKGFLDAPVVGFDSGGFADALDSLFSRKFLGYTLALTLRIPIGNDDARAGNAQAQIELRQGEERLRALRQMIALEVREAHERVEMNRARVQAADVTVRYQQKRLEGEQEKYSVGATTTRFILEAQRDLEDAQSRLVRARIDLIKSRVALDRAVGDTFTVRNIEVKDALRVF